MSPADLLRSDLRLITELVPAGSRVLDLGCSDGSLMAHLRDERGCTVRGIELDHADLAAAVAQGLSVVEADLDDGLAAYPDASFDVVVLSQT
ncbi:MAG: methyltransferase domain-containing protein, partial [Actinobacteria bacterium]